MEFLGISEKFTEANAEALAVPVFKGEKSTSGILKDLNKISGGGVTAVMKYEEFTGDRGQTALLRFPKKGKVKARSIMLLGVGEKSNYDVCDVAVAAGTAARYLRTRNNESFAFLPRHGGDVLKVARSAAQGVVTSQYELDKYKTKDKKDDFVTKVVVCIDGANPAVLKKGLSDGKNIGDSMNLTRDLANEPPNILTPTEMANRSQKMAKSVGLSFSALDEAEMRKLGMNSLLSVSDGSAQPAKLIILRYTPSKSRDSGGNLIALVGKGITFDTGGISLKQPDGMEAMKYDMSGGATVIGAMRAIAMIKPSVPILGIVAAVENMPDGKATRPSDVVTAMNGKTVEILNTDAEGRLVLADAVAYAEKLGATTIIDIATLTGAVIIALGDLNTGIMGNDQELVNSIIECGKENGEGFWQLPLSPEYSKMIKSDIADIKNMGPRGRGGTIMGGSFIQEFIDTAKWAHLDIAGTAWCDSVRPHQAKGPTGVAIRSLLQLVEDSQ